jgi:phosphoribosylanthranilate isomerase
VQRVFVKICGLSTEDSLRAAIEAGADAVGFVFADSPRRVTPKRAMALSATVPAGILRAAVMRHPAAEELEAVMELVRPDWLQTDAEDLAGLRLPAGVEALPVYRDLPDLDSAGMAREDRALFEAAVSGAGVAPDWSRARECAALTRLVLAGGLDPDNVGRAIDIVRPWGVDVSSGVETRPGVKDPAKIAAFITAVRRAERQLERADE